MHRLSRFVRAVFNVLGTVLNGFIPRSASLHSLLSGDHFGLHFLLSAHALSVAVHPRTLFLSFPVVKWVLLPLKTWEHKLAILSHGTLTLPRVCSLFVIFHVSGHLL